MSTNVAFKTHFAPLAASSTSSSVASSLPTRMFSINRIIIRIDCHIKGTQRLKATSYCVLEKESLLFYQSYSFSQGILSEIAHILVMLLVVIKYGTMKGGVVYTMLSHRDLPEVGE